MEMRQKELSLSRPSIHDPFEPIGKKNDQPTELMLENELGKIHGRTTQIEHQPGSLVSPPKREGAAVKKEKDLRNLSNEEKGVQENNRRFEKNLRPVRPRDVHRPTDTGHEAIYTQRSPKINHLQDPEVEAMTDAEKTISPAEKGEIIKAKQTGEVTNRIAPRAQYSESGRRSEESLVSPLLPIHHYEPSPFANQQGSSVTAITQHAKKIITRQLVDLSKNYPLSRPLERRGQQGHELPNRNKDQMPEKVVVEKTVVKEIHHKPEPQSEGDNRRREPASSSNQNRNVGGPLSKLRFGLGQM